MNINVISTDLFNIASNIYSELGGGFNETINQNALAIEFRNIGIKYLKEVNIEIFYKEQSVGVDRPDFVLLSSKKKIWELNKPIVLEIKVGQEIKNDPRQQLKSYLKSFPYNKNEVLQKITKGILLKFLKSEDFINPEKTNSDIELEFWSYNRKTNSMKMLLRLPQEEEENSDAKS